MRKLAAILLAILVLVISCVPAFATSQDDDDTRTGITYGGESSNSEGQSSQQGSQNSGYGYTGSGYSDPAPSPTSGLHAELDDLYGSIPNVSTEDIIGRLEQKGNDIVTMVQIVGRYVCIIGFIIGIILIVVGAIGNKKTMWAGVIALILACLCYAGTVCARDIVNWAASWAIS